MQVCRLHTRIGSAEDQRGLTHQFSLPCCPPSVGWLLSWSQDGSSSPSHRTLSRRSSPQTFSGLLLFTLLKIKDPKEDLKKKKNVCDVYQYLPFYKSKLRKFQNIYIFIYSDKLLCVNINHTFLWKNNYVFQNKKSSEKSGIISHFLQISVMSGLIEYRRVLIAASVLSLLWYLTSRNLWKRPVDVHERKRVTDANDTVVLLWKQTPQIPGKGGVPIFLFF